MYLEYDEVAKSIGNAAIEEVIDYLLSAENNQPVSGILPDRKTLPDRIVDKVNDLYGRDQVWYLISNMLYSAQSKNMIDVGLVIDYDQESRSELDFKEFDIDPTDHEAMFVFKGQDSTYMLTMNHTESTD